jgi:hypothetical protein
MPWLTIASTYTDEDPCPFKMLVLCERGCGLADCVVL